MNMKFARLLLLDYIGVTPETDDHLCGQSGLTKPPPAFPTGDLDAPNVVDPSHSTTLRW